MDGNGRVEIPLVVKPNKSARPKIYDNRAAGADISWASVVVVTGGIEMYWIPPPKVTWPQLLIFPHAIAKPRRRTAGTRWIISRCKRGIWGSNHLQRCGVKTNLLCLRKGFPSTQSRGFGMMAMMLEMMAHTGAYETAVWPPSCWRVELEGWRLVHRVRLWREELRVLLQIPADNSCVDSLWMKPFLNRNDGLTTSIHQKRNVEAKRSKGFGVFGVSLLNHNDTRWYN